MEFQYLLSRAHFGEKVVKHVLVWLLHGSLLWLDQFQNFSAPNCCRASGIVCDLEEVPDRGLILGNRVVIAHRPNGGREAVPGI
jgi:hypothetical protein